MIKNIVTGSSGFVGSHLIKKLDYEKELVHHREIREGKSFACSHLFFLSTYGNMAHHTDHWEMVKANVRDPITILLGWRGWFCYMSSSSVLLPIQTPYSRTKRSAEEILQALPEIKTCIVRPYSITGVGEQKEHLIPTLIRSCMESEPMMFNPFPVHDFVDVEDVVDGLIMLADQEFEGIIEFGNGRPVTNQEVREIVEDVCGKRANAKVSNTPLREYDNSSWYCRKRHPLWNPKKSLATSIREMVEEYRREKT